MKKLYAFIFCWLGFCISAFTSFAESRVPEILPLKLRYPVGTILHYRLARHNPNFKTDGTPSGAMDMYALFTRTRLEDDPQGKIRERFVFNCFKFGQSMTPAPVRMVEFKAARGYTMDYSVSESDGITKLDFSSLPRTLDGFFFMIMTWDAVTFDGMTRPTKTLLVPDAAPIGRKIEDLSGPSIFPFEYPPLVTDSKYSFSGKNEVKVLGVGRVTNVPCAIIEFRMAENTVDMNLRVKPMEVKTHGFEHFWGKTFLSLEDGRIVRGELVGPVLLTIETTMPGKDTPDRSTTLAMGYLEMDLLTIEEFAKELKSQRAE